MFLPAGLVDGLVVHIESFKSRLPIVATRRYVVAGLFALSIARFIYATHLFS